MLGGAAAAAPPPPAPYPSGLPRQLGGYDLESIYPIYHAWLRRGREPALTAALAPPYGQIWQGRKYWGTVFESELVDYDYDIVRKDKLERYCRFSETGTADCEFRYRFALVPGSLLGDEVREPLVQKSFRPEALVKLLQQADWKPAGRNIWSDPELPKLFGRHTDLEAFYRPHVVTYQVDSMTCPEIGPSLIGLDKITLDIAPARQKDTRDAVPIHGRTTRVRLNAMAPSGGRVVVEGLQTLGELLQPLWDVVEKCAPPDYGQKTRAN